MESISKFDNSKLTLNFGRNTGFHARVIQLKKDSHGRNITTNKSLSFCPLDNESMFHPKTLW